MNESDYKKTVLRTYRMRQEIQYVSRRTLVLMFMMWGTFVAAGGSLIVCVNCAGVDEQTSNTLFLSGIVIFSFTSTLKQNIDICSRKHIFPNDFVEKLIGAKNHCNESAHGDCDKEYNQVHFCYKVLEELTDALQRITYASR